MKSLTSTLQKLRAEFPLLARVIDFLPWPTRRFQGRRTCSFCGSVDIYAQFFKRGAPEVRVCEHCLKTVELPPHAKETWQQMQDFQVCIDRERNHPAIIE